MSRNEYTKVKKALRALWLFACALLLCSCSVKSKGSLVSYAKNQYGACKVVGEEVTGTGNDKVRRVHLIDKDTGIEYTVSSGLDDINIDGSSFGHVESTGSDFMRLYEEYVRKNAGEELKTIEKEYNVKITDLSRIEFLSRPSKGRAEAVAKATKKVVDSFDKKGLFGKMTYLVYAEEGEAYLGILDSETGQWSGNDPYAVIDYVQSVLPDAEFSATIYGMPESYVCDEDMERLRRLGCRTENSFDTQFFFFKDPEYGTLVAFDLTQTGLEGFIVSEYHYSIPGRTLDCDALDIHFHRSNTPKAEDSKTQIIKIK